MPHKIEQKIINQALNGDAAAFSEIYFALRGSIYGFAYRMLRDVALAEDLTQEAFMFLLENPKKFDAERGDLLPFLCGIVRNKIIQHFRRHSTKFELSDSEMFADDETENVEKNPLENLLNVELSGKIEEKIAELPPLMREVLILREFEELSYSEIARITETDLGQVKIRLFRARKNLAKELKPYLQTKKEKYYEVC